MCGEFLIREMSLLNAFNSQIIGNEFYANINMSELTLLVLHLILSSVSLLQWEPMSP